MITSYDKWVYNTVEDAKRTIEGWKISNVPSVRNKILFNVNSMFKSFLMHNFPGKQGDWHHKNKISKRITIKVILNDDDEITGILSGYYTNYDTTDRICNDLCETLNNFSVSSVKVKTLKQTSDLSEINFESIKQIKF